jgi:hypothetical protein
MENKDYSDREIIMLDITKQLWRNTLIMTQVGQFKNVSELFNYAVALVCTLQTAAAFGCDEFYLKKSTASNAYKVSIDKFKDLGEEYGALIEEMNLNMEDVNIIEIFNMLGGELFTETTGDTSSDTGEGLS